MDMRTLLALVICLASAIAATQDIVTTPWMVKARQELRDAGLTEFADRWGHQIKQTRYEMAVSVFGGTDRLKELVKKGITLSDANLALLKRSRPLLPKLKRLALELRRELIALGVDFAEFSKSLDELTSDVGFIVTPIKDYQPGQEPEWVRDSINDLKNAGLLVGYPDGNFHHRGKSNYEFAVATHAAWDYLNKIYEAFRAREKRVAEAHPDDAEARKLQATLLKEWNSICKWQPQVAKIKTLVTEFQKELAMLGVDVPELLALFPKYKKYFASYVPPQVGSRYGSFPDVPAEHWAAGAVETLRKAGILVGYPDHKFRG
jgi:hypothetical protein